MQEVGAAGMLQIGVCTRGLHMSGPQVIQVGLQMSGP